MEGFDDVGPKEWITKCKLLDTHNLDLPMYWYSVWRLPLGLSSMRHEAKCIQLFSVVENLLACPNLFSFTAPFPLIISRTQESKDRRLNGYFGYL